MTPKTRTRIRWLGGLLCLIVAGVLVWKFTHPGSTLTGRPEASTVGEPQSGSKPGEPVDPSKSGEPPIHSQGVKTVRFSGVDVSPPSSNRSENSVARLLDLDSGQEVPESDGTGDANLLLSGRLSSVGLAPMRPAVPAGATRIGYEQCRRLLANETANDVIDLGQAPTDYVCLQTTSGRVSLLRVHSVSRQGSGTFVNFDVKYEYWTWTQN
jgi:hypothetical protein